MHGRTVTAEKRKCKKKALGHLRAKPQGRVRQVSGVPGRLSVFSAIKDLVRPTGLVALLFG